MDSGPQSGHLGYRHVVCDVNPTSTRCDDRRDLFLALLPEWRFEQYQSGSLIKHLTAVCGKIPSLRQVRATETSTEKTSLPSAVDIWWLTFLCRTTVSRISNLAPLLWGGMPGYLRKVNRWGAAPYILVLSLWPSG